MRVFIGLEILMPYIFYKGALLTNEEYEKVKDELDQKEREYLKLLLGEELEPKEEPGEASPAEVSEASEEPSEEPVEPSKASEEPSKEPVDDQEVHPNAEVGEKADSGESEVKPARRTRRKSQG